MAFKDLTRSIYDYTLNLAAKQNALTWLFIISFIESSFFPIPPDIMIIPMVLATPKEAYKIAGVATIASVLGGCFGYFIGVYGFELIARPLLEFYGYMAQFAKFENYYHEYGAWIVFGAGCQWRCTIRFSRIHNSFCHCPRHEILSYCMVIKTLWRPDESIY